MFRLVLRSAPAQSFPGARHRVARVSKDEAVASWFETPRTRGKRIWSSL